MVKMQNESNVIPFPIQEIEPAQPRFEETMVGRLALAGQEMILKAQHVQIAYLQCVSELLDTQLPAVEPQPSATVTHLDQYRQLRTRQRW